MIKETLTLADELWTYRRTPCYAIEVMHFHTQEIFQVILIIKIIKIIKFLKCAQNFSLQE
jgi:hypothetical protein